MAVKRKTGKKKKVQKFVVEIVARTGKVTKEKAQKIKKSASKKLKGARVKIKKA